MKIIEELIDELTDKSNSLTDILIKTKVLAYKLKNEELKTWVENELNGYKEEKDIPEYRHLTCQVFGTLTNGYTQHTNVHIPLIEVEEEFKKGIKEIKLFQSISTLDSYRNEDKGNKMYVPLTPYAYPRLSKSFQGGFQVQEARREIDGVQIVQLLTAVKTKLLDFLLLLNEEFGEKEVQDISTETTQDKISSILNSAVFGNNTTIIVGDNNVQKVKNINKGNFEQVEKQFLDNGLEKKDITELQQIIDNDNPDHQKQEFGIKVKEWIQSMIGKVLNGSWQIGIGAAGTLLAETISRYYGWM